MIKNIVAVLLAVVAIALWSDDLSEKQKQYNKIQQDLQNAEAKIQQTEAKKIQKDAAIQSTKKVKGQTEVKLAKAKQEADKKLESLTSVQCILDDVEYNIKSLKYLQESQLETMAKIQRSNITTRIHHKDQYCLALMAAQTRSKLDALGDTQVRLVEEENAKGSEYAIAKSIYQENYTTHRRLDNQVKTLESETKRLAKEKQQLQNQVANLKKASAQLESVISQLMSKVPREGQSYKFSAKTITWPLRGQIIRGFGVETRFDNTSVICNGIDIAVPEWTSVVAADAGDVVYSGSMNGQGKLVIIDHKNGFHTVYAYNNELLVASGAKVSKGQTIAKSGMTGSATVPSLHFEVRKDGKAVNPLAYLD